MVDEMLRKNLEFFISNKIVKTILIVLVCLFLLSTFLFRSEISSFFLKFENYTSKDVPITRDILMRDLSIIQAKEGVSAQVLLLNNDQNINKFMDESFLDTDGKFKEGNIIHVSIMNNLFTNSERPLEIRFLIRAMLYLRERKTTAEVGNIVGIAGGFKRNTVERFEGSQLIKMSVEEFEELYKEIDISGLDTKKQIDALTNSWINKTGYWRRGLYGKEER